MAKNKYRIHKNGEVWRSGRSVWHHPYSEKPTRELFKVGDLEGTVLTIAQGCVRYLPEKEIIRSLFDFAIEKGITEVQPPRYSWMERRVIPALNKKLKLWRERPIYTT